MKIVQIKFLLLCGLLLMVGCVDTAKEVSNEMPEDFAFSLTYGTYGKNLIDTFENVVVKDLVSDGVVEANIELTKEEKQAIYDEMVKANIMGDLYLENLKTCMAMPPHYTKWIIQMNGKTKEIEYEDFCEITDEILQVIYLEVYVEDILSKNKEYLKLPESNGYYE